MSSPVSIALVHHPVVNKEGRVVTTSLTNFDLHDLGRVTRTFGVDRFFIVTPVEVQKKMANYVKSYWREGLGVQYNPDRHEAFEGLEVASTIEESCLTLKKIHGNSPTLIATSARSAKKTISFKELRGQIRDEETPLLLLFGTGWGLAPIVLEQVSRVLEPVQGMSGYNHLPVRSAVAIILDRLFSTW